MNDAVDQGAPNGRATLGEVNRNVLALREDFRKYVDAHEIKHTALLDGWESDKRWLITALVSAAGLAAILHSAVS
jgi:hypothetical protein